MIHNATSHCLLVSISKFKIPKDLVVLTLEKFRAPFIDTDCVVLTTVQTQYKQPGPFPKEFTIYILHTMKFLWLSCFLLLENALLKPTPQSSSFTTPAPSPLPAGLLQPSLTCGTDRCMCKHSAQAAIDSSMITMISSAVYCFDLIVRVDGPTVKQTGTGQMTQM